MQKKMRKLFEVLTIEWTNSIETMNGYEFSLMNYKLNLAQKKVNEKNEKVQSYHTFHNINSNHSINIPRDATLDI